VVNVNVTAAAPATPAATATPAPTAAAPTTAPTVAPTSTPAGFFHSKAAELECASKTNQIVLVEYQGGSSAIVSFHEKVGDLWVEMFSTNGYVGSAGIGKKAEGDNKTPSGTYNLTSPFGIKANPGSGMPYTQVSKYHYWGGTSGTPLYNAMFDSREVNYEPQFTDERLIDYAGYYNYCLFIDYNAYGAPDKGSCIAILATDLPLDSRQLGRVARRISVGLARLGSYIGHGSGEVFLAFSTANPYLTEEKAAVYPTAAFREDDMDDVFRAAAECAEEAVLRSMLSAGTVTGWQGKTIYSLRDLWRPEFGSTVPENNI
jgi:L,D-peptidoglycan transpeptidase YkuD (ErfK/YbiS/YcfS/YnhG family)